jgi:hypothetical protein
MSLCGNEGQLSKKDLGRQERIAKHDCKDGCLYRVGRGARGQIKEFGKTKGAQIRPLQKVKRKRYYGVCPAGAGIGWLEMMTSSYQTCAAGPVPGILPVIN